MDRLEAYLSENYVKEKEQQKSVKELIEKVIPMYEKFYENGWGYKLEEAPKSISTSTIAMISFSMSVLMGGKIDLVINEIGENFLEEFKKKDNHYNKIFKKSLILLLTTFNAKKVKEINDEGKEVSKAKQENTFESSTYGKDDPLTLMWTKHLIDNNECDVDDIIIKEFNNKCKKKVEDIFEKLYHDRQAVEFSSNIQKDHIFPLLKIVQLYYVMIQSEKGNVKVEFFKDKTEDNSIKEKDKCINEVTNILKNSLHHHLSLASIENSNFDAAELVFSLEGMLLLDPNRDNFDKNLLDRVFQVVKARQEISLYWRPLKPFVLNEQGLALLPLSVEIAMSLIRICRLLGNEGKKLFSKNYEMFEKYTEWLKTRVTVVSCNEEKPDKCKTKMWCSNKDSHHEINWYGWCSEHIYQPDTIHPWETSQVLVYLINFNDMLQKHIAYKSFKFANLSIKKDSIEKEMYKNHKEDDLINDIYKNNQEDKHVSGIWKKWQEGEPMELKEFDVYKQIGENYINTNKYYSMLLYGPPGTGKSTIAEKIAEAKGWPLVTITPSDFIASGADQVETKAKNIFRVLEEQENMVVLFDEIDRLILDRDSGYYSSQSDLFQFMTPSMLVKLKDLRKKQKVVLVIATNYEERIDMAIKRKGRIDKHFLVLPPDITGRKKLLEKFSKDIHETYKNVILRETVFFTYAEFEQLADSIIKESDKLVVSDKVKEEELKKLIGKPAITLMSYKGKLGTTENEKNVQKPIREFLSLVYLKAECYDLGIKFENNELGLLVKLLASKEMMGIDNHKKYLEEDYTKDKAIRHLIKILNKESDLEEKLNYHTNNKIMTEKIIEVLVKIKEAKQSRSIRRWKISDNR